jgi:hypothetical protein
VLDEVTIKNAIDLIAQENGFIAEIRAKVWIYAGESL